MSRSTVVLIVIVLVAAGGGLAWYLFRAKPGELDIAAKPLPELPPAKVSAGDWPWWRGPNRDNHSPDAVAPTKWSESENIVWKTPIPGRGHSSPILVGNRIFLTSADEQAQRQFALCLDRATGQIVWEKTIHEKNFPPKHGDNTWASGTPASDGERVFVVFPNNEAIHVTALDLDGKILWTKEVGPHGSGLRGGSHGSGCSVVLWGSYVYVCDSSPKGGRGWVAGLYRENGEIWRKGHKTGMGSYGTLTIAEFNGKPHLIHAGNDHVVAYDPTNGKTIWDTAGFGEVSGNTPAFTPNMVFASTGVPRKLIAVKSDGSVVWKRDDKSDIPYPPSLLWHNGFVYAVSDNSFATCFNAETGEEKWKERIEGGYASPLLVGNNIYACGRNGTTTIFEANPDGYLEVAKNRLDGGISASPVAIGGKLYIRTDSHLYCIGK
jgi:outer membrane protein assembly factor BamB